MIGKHNYNTILNHHLIKTEPLYRVINRECTVKLVKVFKTDTELIFTAEIVGNSKHTTVKKSELSLIKGGK